MLGRWIINLFGVGLVAVLFFGLVGFALLFSSLVNNVLIFLCVPGTTGLFILLFSGAFFILIGDLGTDIVSRITQIPDRSNELGGRIIKKRHVLLVFLLILLILIR